MCLLVLFPHGYEDIMPACEEFQEAGAELELWSIEIDSASLLCNQRFTCVIFCLQ
jgi:hypothetical protein